MDEERADQEPLISISDYVKKEYCSLSSSLKWVLKILMWLVFIVWLICIFAYPLEFVDMLVERWVYDNNRTFLGAEGAMFLMFSFPIIVIVFLAVPYLLLASDDYEQHLQQKKGSSPKYRLWTFPLLVGGPLGVVTAAELIWIILVLMFIIWAVYVYTMRNLHNEVNLLVQSGISFAKIGEFFLAILFVPITRGSVLLRLMDIPFEHAVRYHMWLGHLTMFWFTLHPLCFGIAWATQGRLIQELFGWENDGINVPSGFISLLAGLMMWITSLPQVRKCKFEIFFYTHQLYIVFIFFYAFHVGPLSFSVTSAGILLFMIDRFLRFCQSRTVVDVISASYLPCGSMKLVLSKPKSLMYNALGIVFLQVRELSWLQWHPFSVSSSPHDYRNSQLSLLIKVQGEWTSKLKEIILNNFELQLQNLHRIQHYSPTSITVSVEGPHGYQTPYYLMYDKLVLVAGGIGISPFLAILSDIFYRLKHRLPCHSRNILVIWAMKSSDELSLLFETKIESMLPTHLDNLNLKILIYVTQESEPPKEVEEGIALETTKTYICPVSNRCNSICPLAATRNEVWFSIYLLSSIVGFMVLLVFLNTFYINPRGVSQGWFEGLLCFLCMVTSVFVFGGVVVVFWYFWERRNSGKEMESGEGRENVGKIPENGFEVRKNLCNEFLTIQYGSRPNLREILGSLLERWSHADVGVAVCGPPTLELSVAKECRSFNFTRKHEHPIFHFSSHSIGW